MAKQDRAVRTRAALVQAASAQFDRDGYDGTSLAKVSRAAGISLGALTFHFSSKSELADAVMSEGRALTQAALLQVTARPGPALRTVVELTLELTRLLEEETSVRSSLRLARERPGTGGWSDIWLPAVKQLLDQAHANGQLQGGTRPADVTMLVEYLTAGAEAYLRGRRGAGSTSESGVAQLASVWRLALSGVSTAENACPADGEGSGAEGLIHF
ncbi:TetR/AcrR family transcriptional regulator [Streptomyces lunaelactis]|uniref:TetR/AcrR family transcriptional regulator n=2 Tax=Streptomyces lunaelactis TaxID=1535768 RepID=UPI001585830E|nr:TetR/AcrR family transcriptional regulator [Streptomyces lunaelactis]NUK02257.1 TetR/AcrR family transcriptional regulator [Streptomyces lunaelactis]NUK10829.1 TetR/AcrR family transcriptional regulator [Streptomyces lunaelactis]NUK16121.1 TetR/AcrR family transcriptional regulator [Streptomyces lunaelactis]NUK22856.1 TetR/AcrR family transcriptional regulator [Streptomyces lunaelactis]NUK34965.1 TetR/AcrR family transcriptional regulator [Streptomyces lunaelactis]